MLRKSLYRGERPSYLYNAIEELCVVNKLSMREIETYSRYLEVLKTLSPSSNSLHYGNGVIGAIEAIGVFIVCFHNSLAKDLLLGSTDLEPIFNIMSIKPIIPFENKADSNLNLPLMSLYLDYLETNKLRDSLKEVDKEQVTLWSELLTQNGLVSDDPFANDDPIRALEKTIRAMSFHTD